MTVAGFTVVNEETLHVHVDETPAGESDVAAVAERFNARHHDGHRFDLLDIRAENGERWVECRKIETPSPRLRSLDGRLRLGVSRSNGRAFCELRQARPKGGAWSNLYKASLADLNAAAGVNVVRELRAVGATALGTRGEVLGDDGQRRSFMCVTFDPNASVVPIIAFVLTRAAPLLEA
jgi:hypothetical protein